MRSWALAAGLMGAAVTVATGAKAADLYKYPKGPAYAPYAGPRERIYSEDEYYDDDARPRRYSYAEPGPYAGRCLPREVVKDRLLAHGWHDFHHGDIRGD